MFSLKEFFNQCNTAIKREPIPINLSLRSLVSQYKNGVIVYSSRVAQIYFLTDEVKECFNEVFSNNECSLREFETFSKIIDKYIEIFNSITGFRNELNNTGVKLPYRVTTWKMVGGEYPAFPLPL